MKSIAQFVLIVLVGYFIFNKFIKYPYRYVGYFYPRAENLDNWIESKPLGSVDECRDWADEMADKFRIPTRREYDYECGKDCYIGDPYFQGVTYTCRTSVD